MGIIREKMLKGAISCEKRSIFSWWGSRSEDFHSENCFGSQEAFGENSSGLEVKLPFRFSKWDENVVISKTGKDSINCSKKSFIANFDRFLFAEVWLTQTTFASALFVNPKLKLGPGKV